MFGGSRHDRISVVPMAATHFPDVLEIARRSCEWPAKARDLQNLPPLMAGMVAIRGGLVIGYAFFEAKARDRLELVQVVTFPTWRRHGVGRAMVAEVARHARPTGRSRLVASVDERDMDALKFFRAIGWRAIHLQRGFYREESGDHDAIRMACDVTASVVVECSGK